LPGCVMPDTAQAATTQPISDLAAASRNKMPFVSYAQNCEDVMLHRALRTVQHGFYVDVGANDPVCHSVTKAFYERGWRGINIEPVPSWFEKIEADRAEDINLQIAITDTDGGEADFYEVADTGLSTLHEPTALRHANEHGYKIEKRTVGTATLTSILDRHAAG